MLCLFNSHFLVSLTLKKYRFELVKFTRGYSLDKSIIRLQNKGICIYKKTEKTSSVMLIE